jgi:predicted CoA-binding protein
VIDFAQEPHRTRRRRADITGAAMPHANPSDDELRRLLTSIRTIAVVGASAKPDRPSNGIMKMLIEAGYRVIPVTPKEEFVLGRRAYPSLEAVPEPIDVVDVFRRAEETPPIAEQAVKVGARVLWLQLGITNDDAARIAASGGLTVIMDLCIGQTVHRLGVKAPPPDEVTEAGIESFPASDPPAWTPLHPGSPERQE